MAESNKPVPSGTDTRYDFSRYVFIHNRGSKSYEDVTNYIRENTPYRIISNNIGDSSWTQVLIKYPNRKIAIVEANKFYLEQVLKGQIGVDMVAHILAFLNRIERECKESLKGPSSVIISNIPESISVTRWKVLLSRFGKVVVETVELEGEPCICATYDSFTEAMAMGFALHHLNVNGKKLITSLCKGEKEHHVTNIFRKKRKQCSCLIIKCGVHLPPARTITSGEKVRGDDENGSSCHRPLLCCFCYYPERHPFQEYVDSELKYDNDDVSWEDEFPELKEDMIVKDNWILVDEENPVASSSLENWNIMDFCEFSKE